MTKGDEIVGINRDAYDTIAAPYGKRIESLVEVEDSWIAGFTKKLQDVFLEQISAGDSAKILEIGPGNGSAARYFLSNGAKVTGIDISVKMMEQAEKKAPKAVFIEMDMRKIILKRIIPTSKKFDGVWADGCVYHVAKEDIPKVFKGVHRALKPGGIFFFNFKSGKGEVFEDDPRSFGRVPRFYAYYHSKEMREIVEREGFEVMTLRHYPKKVLGEKIIYVSAIKK